MGNYSSCIKFQNLAKSKNLAKLVDSQGQLTLVNLPITVAELMVENPGFAVTPVEELRIFHRIPAMKADEMLVGRKVYLLVPVEKVNSRLTGLQLTAIEGVLCPWGDMKMKRTRGSSKVFPVHVNDNGLTGQMEKDLGGKSNGITGQRKSFCKGWKPVLEPILEGF
ncbi:unnamed protein product [Amaranthus hypochondriacus]